MRGSLEGSGRQVDRTPDAKECVMQTIQALLEVYSKRGIKRLPLERVYRQLFNRELYLKGYGKIYRNFGSMTPGSTEETVDGMSLQKINTIIGLLKMGRYKWTPARRIYIEKANGKLRPLSIPTWGDKLLQEVIRSLLEPYYEQQFSDHSHGFRPKRGCHTALNEIRIYWRGTVWFIEGDIKGCFDNIDHTTLLEIIRRNIHDDRLLNLLSDMLKAGYLEDWRYYDTLSGAPQGGVISPILSNIYLNELDRFVEGSLIPTYTKGERRKPNREYANLQAARRRAIEAFNFDEARRLRRLMRELPSVDNTDPDYRRLRYVRYADDFLLGFAGPRDQAESIKQQIGEFLGQQLKLTLSTEKTLITHAADGKAKFLGYEINVARDGTPVMEHGESESRAARNCIMLWMPKAVVQKYRERHSRKGKVVHCGELTLDSDYTIVQRFQSVNRGLYNYYCMAINVGQRVGYIQGILRKALLKTLACKYKTKTRRIRKIYTKVTTQGKVLQATMKNRAGKELTATFGGFPITRIPDGMGVVDFSSQLAWQQHANKRSEVVQRLLAGKCELCGREGPVEVHHIRKLADINRPGRRPKNDWGRLMSARKRKTLVVCSGENGCHRLIHTGNYDGPKL